MKIQWGNYTYFRDSINANNLPFGDYAFLSALFHAKQLAGNILKEASKDRFMDCINVAVSIKVSVKGLHDLQKVLEMLKNNACGFDSVILLMAFVDCLVDEMRGYTEVNEQV